MVCSASLSTSGTSLTDEAQPVVYIGFEGVPRNCGILLEQNNLTTWNRIEIPCSPAGNANLERISVVPDLDYPGRRFVLIGSLVNQLDNLMLPGIGPFIAREIVIPA
jgi:hypothetical protein